MNWVVPGKLIAGPYLGALGSSYDEKKMQVLQKVGVQHVFDLTTRHDDLDPYTFPKALSEVKRHSSPVIDMDVATDVAAIKLAMGVIGFITAKETPVYVHCWGGHGRTGVLVSLIQAGLDPKVTAQLALQRTRWAHNELRTFLGRTDVTESPQTDGQKQQVVRVVPLLQAKVWPQPTVPSNAPGMPQILPLAVASIIPLLHIIVSLLTFG